MKTAFLTGFILTVSLMVLRAQNKTYVFATYTYSTNNRLQNMEPMVKYLSEQTGLKIIAKSYPTVPALIEAIKKDSVDFAMMNTSGYLVLHRNNPGIAIPLVNLDMGNIVSTNYGGCLIATKQTGISSIKNYNTSKKKLNLALVNNSSTSGNLVPRLIMNSYTIPNPEISFNVTYSGTHKKVVEDILSGRADVGGCGCAEVDSARKYLGFDSKAVVIDSFTNIPLGPIVYNKKLEKRVYNLISKELLKIHQTNPDAFINFCNGWTEFKQAKKFKIVSDKEYDDFRKMFGDNKKLWSMIE
jgi:phosphonate transport system substrate-binding protein